MHAAKPAAFSAPGKALFAGGYLVLFPEYSALSLGLSSRMHAVASSSNDRKGLLIKSPQFSSEWRFPGGGAENPFLEACYEVTQNYFNQAIEGTVTIWSDSGFHSQAEAKKNHFPDELARFSFHGRPINKVPKTGLGSSAALVVITVAAISYIATSSQGNPPLESYRIHNLSQIAHCMAQKKVGSGFDVATAVFGSILYSRFPKEEIPNQIDFESLQKAVNRKWAMQLKPCSLPKNVSLLMGDVARGSETPGMVKQVLKWKEENPEVSQQLFEELNKANMDLAKALDAQQGDYDQIREAIRKIRGYLQHLTSLTCVPIEPPKQTELLDKASSIQGVLGGIVPGAGGDDAICVLFDNTCTDQNQLLSKLNMIEGVHWIPFELESSGLKQESAEIYLFNP